MKELETQINKYLKGDTVSFNLQKLGISSDFKELKGTLFQKKIWRELLRIPYGKTVTYLDIAKKIKKPESVRAVANAIAANPLHIIVPCHRVLPSHPKRAGDIGGYAGGVEVKRWLLWHEQSRG